MFEQFYETLNPQSMHYGENTPHAYFIPFDKEQKISDNRRDSRRLTLLNGTWDFRYYESVRDFTADFNPETEKLTDTMPVPGVIQLNGFDSIQYTNVRFPFPYDPPFVPADNPCGLYRRTFNYDKKEKRVYQLVFEGVDSCLLLWMNGRFIGASQVSHSPAEYDVTAALQDGVNTLCALVLKWCGGSYCEDQDKFRYTGIFRDVYILERDEAHLSNFTVTALPNEDLTKGILNVKLTFAASACPVHCELYDGNGGLVREGDAVNGSWHVEIENPALWTAETPNLYKLILRCGDEVISQKTGFRKVEIKNEVVLLNNRPVHFRGVNMHESSCDTGAYTPLEHIRRDLMLIKQHNMNAIRTSHYPQPPEFYEMCNEMGIYVLDEADQECHGVVSLFGSAHDPKMYNLMADDPKFGPMILDRVQRMVKRDRNFTCVVIYSMGNESGYGVNFEDALAWTKAYDATRLTHYERASFPPEGQDINRTDLDLYSRMYPSVKEIKRYFKEHTVCKPYILCEYCHAMGNGPGDLEDYFRYTETEERFCGAFVWEWCNHAPCIGTNEKGQRMYRYGGDFGETLHDGNFCADGLVNSDRTPTPGLLEYKNVLRPLRVVYADLANGWIELKNEWDYVSTKGKVSLKIALYSAGTDETTVEVENVDIPARGTGRISVPAMPGGSCVIETLSKADTPWLPRGSVLGFEQVGMPAFRVPEEKRDGGKLRVSGEGERYVTVTGDDFSYCYDSMKGTFAQMIVKGKTLLYEPMRFNIWRAPTDNDRVIKQKWNECQYRYAVTRGMGTECEEKDGTVVLSSFIRLGTQSIAPLAGGKVMWTIYGDGRIGCAVDMDIGENIPVLPRLGLVMKLPKEYAKLCYFAYGPNESYADEHQSSLLLMHESTVAEEYKHPLRPQESGSHYGAKYVRLAAENEALKVYGDDFSFSALPYSPEQLTDVMHDDELEEENQTVLCLDMAHRGIGSNSCGPALDECYEIRRHIEWQGTIDPLAQA